MRRDAFTMIELVFVIVILGILAAVAIPKLSATRDDAKVSAMMSLLAQGTSEVADYVVSQGKVEDDLTTMSNAFKSLVDRGVASSGTKKIDVKFGNISDCVSVQVVTNGGDEDIDVLKGNAGSDVLCTRLQTLLSLQKISISLTGARVVY
jgi:prepilin-type N-terminal cleavage/methylation domain-containing protein